MKALSAFMSSPAGRILRIIAGIILIWLGWFVVGGAVGIIVAIIGLVPLLAGIFDVCLLAGLFGLPIQGSKLRQG